MTFQKATQKYEAWLGEQMPLIHGDVDLKHARKREGPFPFLRATFYRWAQTFPKVCAPLMKVPQPLAVGDLHVENFGTWRDAEGRLIWGVNDFDEACRLPYTVDLVRLATSAHLAIAADHLQISKIRASKAILAGYLEGLKARGRAFVLAEHHHSLRQVAIERLKEPEKFWEKLRSFPAPKQEIPSSARKGLLKTMPERKLALRFVHRVAGLGSLGRRRFVALAEWRGGSIAREAKELTYSAWRWACSSCSSHPICYRQILQCPVRCPDPFVQLRGRWLVRRLAPDCSRIELSSLPRKNDSERLLHAMGWETANIHLGSVQAGVLLEDVTRRASSWLHSAAEAMAASTIEDWKAWQSAAQA